MARVRLKNPAYKTFSSYMGTTKFKNGVSESDVSDAEIRILGAITAIEVIDDEGNAKTAGPAQNVSDLRSMEAPVEKKLEPEGEPDTRAEITPEPVEIKGVEPKKEETEEAQERLDAEIAELEQAVEGETKREPMTREELEAIADEKGITGLREIGNELGVKSNSIEDLIGKILAAQKG